MRNSLGFLVVAASAIGCKPNESIEQSIPCTPRKSDETLNIEGGTETTDYPEAVLILSNIPGAATGTRFKCTGTIVGHNAVLTAAHCIRSSANTTYVMQTGSLRSAQEQFSILKSAVTPINIFTHGTISHSDTFVSPEYMADDLAVLLFRDQTFRDTDVIIPSLQGFERPARFANTIMVGFGKSSETDDPSKTSIKRVGSGFYLVEDAIAKGLAVTYTNEMDRETLTANGLRKFSRAHQGDSGGPLFIRRDGRLDILGVASAGGPASSGNGFFTAYVDLFTPRSTSLLRKASSAGARFSEPSPGAASSTTESSDATAEPSRSNKKCVN